MQACTFRHAWWLTGLNCCNANPPRPQSHTSEAVITSRRNMCSCGGAGGSPVAASPAASPSAPTAMADGTLLPLVLGWRCSRRPAAHQTDAVLLARAAAGRRQGAAAAAVAAPWHGAQRIGDPSVSRLPSQTDSAVGGLARATAPSRTRRWTALPSQQERLKDAIS